MKPLLHLQITEVMANMRERSWDSSAAISVKDIVIFDHITLGRDFVINCIYCIVRFLFSIHLEIIQFIYIHTVNLKPSCL